MSKFGLTDYIKMAKARGIRLPVNYFIQNHLFDLIRGVDTHVWEPDSNLRLNERNKDDGVFYMASWKSTVVESTNCVINRINEPLENFTFLDVGCGKGKVILVWDEILPAKVKIVGIDYNDYLLSVCRSNLRKRASTNRIQLVHSDITKINLDCYDKLVLYLYNPFSKTILEQFLKSLKAIDLYVIYNNPIHDQVFETLGFTCLNRKSGWHPNTCFNLYKKVGQ